MATVLSSLFVDIHVIRRVCSRNLKLWVRRSLMITVTSWLRVDCYLRFQLSFGQDRIKQQQTWRRKKNENNDQHPKCLGRCHSTHFCCVVKREGNEKCRYNIASHPLIIRNVIADSAHSANSTQLQAHNLSAMPCRIAHISKCHSPPFRQKWNHSCLLSYHCRQMIHINLYLHSCRRASPSLIRCCEF